MIDLNLRETMNSPLGDRHSSSERDRIHPHKFTLWVAIGSIVMMFAGLTSAYIVKSGQVGWHEVRTPGIFWASTATLLASSLTIQAAIRSFKQRNMNAFRGLFLATVILGFAFIVMQWIGFNWLWDRGVKFEGSSGAGQFLYIIFGLHGLHVLGGIVALLILFLKNALSRTRSYSSVPLEIMATYWHFVDLLWIYLLVFFIWIG